MINRRSLDKIVTSFSILSTFLVILVLLWIIKDILINGFRYINLDFFTKIPNPPGVEGGGLANAIYGTFIIALITTIISVPIGILGGTYVSEYAKNSFLSNTIRWANDILISSPSIILGAFVYAVVVKPMKGFSAISGSVALSLIMIPTILKTTDEVLKLVPNIVRESAYALGSPKWRVIFFIVYRAVKNAILTSILIGFSRIIGETAPLLFTSFNNSFFEFSVFKPISTITVNIFNFAMSPYDNWHNLAWAGALFLMIVVLFINFISRFLFNKL